MYSVPDVVFFFFKQKTAYEMRISDWSSDVCSSDLGRLARHGCTAEFLVDRHQHHREQPPPEAARPRPVGHCLQPLGERREDRSEERRVGKSVSVRVDLGGRRIIKKKKRQPERS